MIVSPIEVKIDDGSMVRGVMLGEDELGQVIALIDSKNADGLRGKDLELLLRLKEAMKDFVKAAAEG